MGWDATLALVTLAELPRVGERRLTRLQHVARSRHVTLTQVTDLTPSVLARDYGLPPPALVRLQRERFWHAAHCKALVSQLSACGALVSQPGEASYPKRWLERGDPPPPLAYVYGATHLLAAPSVALLASRGVSEQMVIATLYIAQRAAREDFALVVGGMKSTHRIAAVSSRAAGAARIVVLDRGLFAAFGGQLQFDPFGFGPGRSRFDPRTTLVLSMFRPYNHATPRAGRRRDELIAALGDLVVALSVRPGGEVERICLRALDRGQRVLVWQGDSRTLLTAGAVGFDERDLQRGLRRFLPVARR